MDGHHSAPGLRVLPAEHGRHDVTARYQHGPVSWQNAAWAEAGAHAGSNIGSVLEKALIQLLLRPY